MSLANIQFQQKQINKYVYKKLLEGSRDEMWNSNDLYTDLKHYLKEIFDLNERQLKVVKKINGEDRTVNTTEVASMIDDWLDKIKVDKLCQEYKGKKVNLIYATFDVFSYSNECLDILSLLSKGGVALFYVPAQDYKKIFQHVNPSHEFHINAIFGSYDERDTINSTDKEYIRPLRCKYMAVLITKLKKETLYLWPEFSIFDGEHQELIGDAYESGEYLSKDLKSFLDGGLPLTDRSEVYKRIISANRVVVKTDEFDDVENFYTNAKIYQSQKWFPGYSKNKLGEIGKNLANDPIGIVNFLQCVDNDGELDINKWRAYVTTLNNKQEVNNKSKRTSKENIDDLFYLLDEHDKAKSHTPRGGLKNIEQIYIFETYSDEFTSPYIKAVHPIDWSMGEIKSSSHEAGVFNSSLMVLDPSVIIDKYLIAFLKSEAGLLSITKAFANSTDYSEAWKDIEIPLPDLDKQKIIASAMSSATSLESELSILKEQLIKNPNKASEIDDNLKDWLDRLDKLSIDEKIIKLVESGETKTIEFKETLSLDVRKQTKEKYIALSSLKTISGFLNSQGGVLLIGVQDNGERIGLQGEIDKSFKGIDDELLKYFKNILKTSVGEEYYPYIDYQLVNINESKVLYVNCEKSEKPCYLNGKDFYVRTNPATDKLEGPKLVNYIQNHFH